MKIRTAHFNIIKLKRAQGASMEIKDDYDDNLCYLDIVIDTISITMCSASGSVPSGCHTNNKIFFMFSLLDACHGTGLLEIKGHFKMLKKTMSN